MQLIVLTGFLGSGKTTALLSFARELSGSGAKVAIIVNEIGDIGIDNLLLKQLGANMWELLGGCICCTLVADLGTTLSKISADYAPDYVFLEPSGASNPGRIPDALQYSKDLQLSRISWLAIVDPLRLEELVTVLEPLMESHLRVADIAIITKKDEATPEQIEAARKWIASLRPELPCVAVDMKSETGRASLRELIPCLN
jgi:G3E family GTPase